MLFCYYIVSFAILCIFYLFVMPFFFSILCNIVIKELLFQIKTGPMKNLEACTINQYPQNESASGGGIIYRGQPSITGRKGAKNETVKLYFRKGSRREIRGEQADYPQLNFEKPCVRSEKNRTAVPHRPEIF